MEATVEAKKKALKVPPSAVVPGKAVKEAEKALRLAQDYYSQMQRNWFQFAKEIKEIRDNHYYEALRCESFQKLCEREFPSVHFTTIVKFIHIVEALGEQLEKKMENPEYQLPAYDTCYRLTTAESRLKKEDFTKLKKGILENKFTVRAFREQLAELLQTAKKELRTATDEEVTKFQRDLDSELKSDRHWDEDEEQLADDEDFDPSEEEDIDEDAEVRGVSAKESTVIALSARMDYLIENLPEYIEQIETIDSGTKSLLKKMKKLVAVTEDAIQTIEE